jgi:hypothetical protein
VKGPEEKRKQSRKGTRVEKEAVRKGSKKSRSSPVKQPSQKTQADSGHQKREWTSGVASSRTKIYQLEVL